MRGYSCWLRRWVYEVLDVAGQCVVVRLVRNDGGFDHLSTLRVGNADGGGLLHGGVAEQHVFDFCRAHGPAGGNDHVIGTTGVEEIAVFVDPAAVLGQALWRQTLISPISPFGQADPSGRCTSTFTPGTGLPSAPALGAKSSAPG